MIPLSRQQEIPAQLKALPNWVSWQTELKDGKETKVPYIPGTDKHASVTDPSSWRDFETAVNSIAGLNGKHGIGFVIHGAAVEAKIVGFDFDGCLNPETGEITEWADDILKSLGEPYTEITPSQTGLRAWVIGELPGPERVFNLAPRAGFGSKVKIEVFDRARYFTVTGDAFYEGVSPLEKRDLTKAYELCRQIKAKYPAEPKTESRSAPGSTPVQITRTGIFITSKLDLLMSGEVTSQSPFIVADQYGNSVEYASQSEADQALCSLLAIEHKDAAKIDEEFRKSSLYRQKWERNDYRDSTIKNALETANRPETRTNLSPSGLPLPKDAIGMTANGIPIFSYPQDENESFEDIISVADLESKGDVIVEYPDPGTDDLVSSFAARLVSGTSLPLAFVRETLKNMTNQLIDGYNLHPVYPDLSLRGFHFNYGPSWIGKTKSFDEVMKWMKREFEKRDIWTRDLLAYGSKQFLIRMLSTRVPLDRFNKPKGKPGNPLQFLHVREGTRIASDGQDKFFKSIFALLTDLYDQTEAETGSFTNDQWSATGVKVSAIVNITPIDFRMAFEGKGSIGSGGLPRWTIAAPPKQENATDWVRMNGDDLCKTFELLIQRLPKVATKMLQTDRATVITTPVVLTEEEGAKQIRLAVHNKMERAGKAGLRLTEYFIREQVNRAVFSTKHPHVMTAKDAEKIADWADAQLEARSIWPVDAGMPVERNEVTIRRTVNRHFVTETKLKDACHYYRPGSGGVWSFDTALANMLKNDIKCVGVAGQRQTPVFCPCWCQDHPRIKILK